MDNPSSEEEAAKLVDDANKALFVCDKPPSPTDTTSTVPQIEPEPNLLENESMMAKQAIPPQPPSEIPEDIADSETNDSDLSETEDIDDYPSLNDSYANELENSSLGGLKRKRKIILEDSSENNNNNINELKKFKSMDLIIDPDELDKDSDNLLTILDQSVSQLAAFSKDEGDDDLINDEIDENFDISEKLREMGEISVKPIKSSKPTASADESIEDFKTNSNSNDESDDKRKITNLRKNIREVMDDNQLDASTLAAQRQELERLARVQEQQKIIREVQRQIALERQNNKTQTRVMSLLQGHTSLLKNSSSAGPSTTLSSSTSKVTLPGSSASVLSKLSSTDIKSRGIKFNDNLRQIKSNLTPSVSIAPVKGPIVKKDTTFKIDDDLLSHSLSPCDDDDDEDEDDDDDVEPIDDDLQSKKDVVTIVDSSDDDCIVLSDDEEIEEEEDDPQNSGLHVNDTYNVPNESGNVVINIGHPESEASIFVAPQIARIIKPHQIGGVRFLFDNVIESVDRFDSSTGFGCILAHSMGLGKTLQLVCFCDIFLRHTSSKTVLCIMPINTLQNWLAEFNMWLPEDPEKSPLRAHGEVRPRNFKLFVLNDSHKTLNARSKVVLEWAKEGGVLLIGYEMYRLLSLKKMTKKKKKNKKFDNTEKEAEQTDEQKQVWDEIHTALVKPGPDLVICDEGHRIKNSHASISVALKQIRSKRRIVLTGYPLQNNLQEYWCMVDFVRPNYLGTKSEFANMFERPIQNGQCIDSTPQDIKLMRYRAHVLHSLLLGFVQRRSHAVLQSSLPQKEEYVLLVRMTTFQRKLYDVFMNEVVRKKAVPNPLKAFAVCCKIWNHPDVLYNFLKKREADLDLELEESEVVAGAANTGKTPVGKGKNKCSPKKSAGRKSKIFDSSEKNGKPAATISPSTGTASTNKSNEVIPKQEIKVERLEETPLPKMENLNNSGDFIKQEPKTDVNMNNSNTSETSMSSSPYPSSNYSSGYGSQGSYDSYNPYSTPQHNMYNNDPYGNYGSTQNAPQNNYNYGNYGAYNQNDYWQNPNYYNQNYNQNYNQHYDNSYYQPNYNDQRYSQQYQSNPNDNQQNWNQNQQQMHQSQQQPQTQQQKSQTPPESKSQEIVDLDTKEIKLEVRKEESEPPVKEPEIESPIKNPLNKSDDTINEEINSLKLDELKSDEPDKDLLTKLITSPTKEDGIPYDWAVELMKGYIPDLIENSPKMEVFLCILDESLRLGDRMLVFSQSLLTLNLIEKFLQAQKIPGTESSWIKNVNYYRLDGSTPAIEREKLINEFNSNPNIHLFLVSTRAGSLGINLVGANRVIVFDASWNPCHDTQAVCRVYRYGQKKPCFVYRLVMDNCLEKRIYDRQVNKQGMSDRVVDECNPDAHLSLKEVTNLCWDDEEETEIKDFNDSKDKYIDIVMQKVIELHSKGLSKEPFQHESLLVDRKEKKLSSAEKRLAQRGYELEKQAATRPSYIYNPGLSTSYRAIRTQDGSIVHRPVASVRPMQADMNSDKNNAAARPGGARPTRWIPAEVWQRQGMSAQEMTLPLDVVIPTSSAEKANIVLKAGQKVMVLKSPKGIYMQLETGKIIAIRTAFKMGQTNKDKISPAKPNMTMNKNSANINIPSNLKNNASITVVPAKSSAQGVRTGVMQTMMKNRNLAGNKNIQLGTARPYNMKQNIKSPFSSFMARASSAKDADDSSTNSSDKLYDGEVNDLSKDDDDDVDLSNLCDDDIEELKSDDEDDQDLEKNIKLPDTIIKMDVEIEPKVDAPVEPEPPLAAIVEPSKDETPPTPTQVVQESVTCNNSNSNTNSNSNSGDNTNSNSNSNNSGSNGGNNNGSNNNNYSNNGNGNNATPNNNGGNSGNNNNGGNNNNNNNNNPNNNNNNNPNNNNNNNSNGNDNNNENSENSNENTANANQNNGASNTPGPNDMKVGSMQMENDDVIMVSSSQNFPPKTIDSYSIPSCYGMTYGNYPPYYHQSYSYMNPHMQQQQQYYNYPMQSGMHPAAQYHGQMSNMPGNPYMPNHMHSNPHAKSYHHNVANSHAENNQMQSHGMSTNSSTNNQYSNSSGNSQQNASSNASNNSIQTPSHNTPSKQNNTNYGHFSHNQANNPPNTTTSTVIPPPSVTQSYTSSSTSTTTTSSQTTPTPFLSNVSSNIPPSINHHNSLIPPPSSDISSFPPMPSSNNVISNIQPPQPPIPSQSNMSSALSGNIFPSYTTANISSSGPTSTSQQSTNNAQYSAPTPNSSSSMYSHPTSNSTNTLPHYSTSKANANHMSMSTSSSGIPTNTATSMSTASNNPPATVAGSNPSIPPYSSYSASNMSLIPPPSFANLPPNTPGTNFPGFQSHSSNQTTMPSQSTTPTSSSSYSSSQFPPFPPHSSSYLSSLQFPPHSSFSPLSHPFGGGSGYSQSGSVSSTPPSNYGQSGMQQSGHMQQYPYHSQSSQTPPQITHSVTSMTNQLTPSTSSTTPTISNQIPHSGSSPQMNQQQQQHQQSYNSSVTTPSQTQTKPIVSATVSTPIMIDDDMEPAPIREKMSYKQQNMIERKGSRSNQNDMIDPYMQQHQHQSSQPPPHPNMYHDMYATQKTSKNSLKNYRHNKMSARQMPPTAANDGGMESPHTPQNPHVNSPGPMNSNYSMPPQQIPPPSSIPASVSPQNLNYQPNMYPMYDAMPPQNRHHGGGPKSYHTPSPHSYHSSVASPSQMSGPVGPNVAGAAVGPGVGGQQPPKIESSLSFLEKTASAINDDKNGFQASLSNITRSYSPSPNPNYNDMMPSTKSSPAATTTMKPKRQNKTTKKEKAKLKAAMMTNIEPPQKPKTPNIQNIPTGPYSAGGMVPGGGGGSGGAGGSAPPTGPPFMNTTESLFQNIPTTLSGPLFSSSFSYGGYNTVPSSIPPPIINDQMNQASLPTTTSGQHFSSPYGGYLPQYTPTTVPSNASSAQSSNVTTSAAMSPAPVTTAAITSSANTTSGGYSANSNIPTTSTISNLIPTNTTSNYDQSIPSPQVSGSAFHRPDVSAYASPYLPPGAGPEAMASSVPSYVPPSGPYSSSGNGYGSSSGIPPPIPPYQPGGYATQFPQNLPPPSVSTTPAYPPYGYSPGPYGVASQYGGPPPSTYPPLGSTGGMPVSYDPQRISSVPNSEQYPGYTPSYSSFPPYAPQSGQWQ